MDVSEVQGKYKEYSAEKKNDFASNMDKDMFLELLVAQMRNQDPLNPMEDREFIAQMAQFSSLEQMQNLNSGLDSFKEEVMEQIQHMNNNMVLSQTNIVDKIALLNTTVEQIINAYNNE
ncbi:MAG: flagellar hook capping protein [Alkaliphilus sp.]|jgi:flagellar basal-body rod modification protein FlgD|nr:flagellar hook capping protein [Alkaliphilus transvaalensis]MBN4069415.1 flagellar hook capping protein [bacterium AH-315-G05]PHS35247.1 MAG: flagellar hook capping protein [Alkaliphilus sp.]